jgi:DNA-binding SARP family transcriptional activator
VIQSMRLLGSFRVCADPSVKIPKKGTGLLALLAIAALCGEGMSRERLSTMLWPHQDTENARHSLRNCLLELRKALRTDAIKTLITDVTDCRVAVETDVADFLRLEKSDYQQDLEMAAELYRGELLDNFWIESEPFREWLEYERSLWRQRAIAVLIRVSTIATTNADHGASIRAARRVVHFDPWNEVGQRLLIAALHTAGHRGEAALQFRRYRETLKQELGIEPDPETTDLAERLFAVKSIPPAKPVETIWAVEPMGVEPQDEVLLRRAMKMLDEAREEIRDNLDHSARLVEALRLDRETMEKVLLRLERIMDTRQVGMKSLEAMRDEIKRRLGDEHIAPAPRSREHSNGEVGVEMRV